MRWIPLMAERGSDWIRSRATFSAIAAVLPLLSSGCGDESRSVERTELAQRGVAKHRTDKTELSCEDAFEVETRIGRLTNNMWNKQAIGSAPYRQCLLRRDARSEEEYGWSWDWPTDNGLVLAFPEIVMGWKPWTGGSSTRPELPIRINAIGRLQLTYAVETRATGEHVLSIALWLTRSGVTRVEPNPSDITADINIWLDGAGFQPAGTHLGDALIDGARYEVWHAENMGDASGASAARWGHMVYRSQTGRPSASLDIRAFLEDAAQRKLISRDEYVSSIEIGNEIMSGAGETWVRELKLQIR